MGFAGQPEFLNLVAEVSWSGGPDELLTAVQSVERRVGRRPSFPGGPREIDVDILDYGGAVRDSPVLALPHPRMASRRFVLLPLSEIAPRWRHPVSGRTAGELMEDLPARPGARRVPLTCAIARGFAALRPGR